MVAMVHRYAKSVAGTTGNMIATHSDDMAANMEQMYARMASQINEARQGQVSVNRVPSDLTPSAGEAAMAQRQAQAAQVAEEAAANAGPNMTDRVVGKIDTGLQIAGMAPIIVGGAQMATTAVTKVGSAVGGMVGLSSAKKVADAVKPRNWNEISFTEIGEATGTKNLIGAGAQHTANFFSSPIGWIADKTGLSGWRARSNTASAATQLKKAKDALATLTTDDKAILGALHTHVDGAGHIGDVVAKTEVKGLLETAKQSENLSKLSAPGKQFLSSVEDSMMHHENAAMWGDVKGAVQKAPESMGKTSASHGIMNAAFIGMSALSMFGDARGFAQNLESLRQMYADMTGEDVKKVSTVKLLTGKVPEPVAAARSHLITKFGVKQAFDIGNIALNVAMMVNHKWGSSWKAIAAMMGTQVASSVVDGMMGESILPIHKAFSDAHKSGREIPAEFYAAYLYSASKELRSRGEKGQEFAMQLGQEYAAERAGPGQLLQEIENGKMLDRIKNITTKQDRAQASAQMAESFDQGNSRKFSGDGKGERAVVGKYTNRLNQEAQMAEVGQGLA